MDLAVISGTGFYDFPGLEEGRDEIVDTKFGDASVRRGIIDGKKIVFIARHGKNHSFLPNMINHRANLLALIMLETKALISTTVCGVLDPSVPLARLAVFDDLYFPDNRLPKGEACTVYDEIAERGRGHYIFDKPFSEELRQQLIEATPDPITRAVYAHVNGPRFNSKSEISMLKNYASFISQTAGPEAVLAGELEIPCALIGFGVDYANGVAEEPTPVEVLNGNLKKSKEVFVKTIRKLIENYRAPSFSGFIYRFE
ncbi:MAG: MTAP family purine nucleoside phosphorylase [Candidatus Aminicenantes bacterium]|nr:MAG: MTAP family purine nucleoside phosphorylase [Candidatus Aminicenantes bacterium]